jgi:cell division protease FtsH
VKSKKSIWIWIILILVLIALGVAIYLFTKGSSNSISAEQLRHYLENSNAQINSITQVGDNTFIVTGYYNVEGGAVSFTAVILNTGEDWIKNLLGSNVISVQSTNTWLNALISFVPIIIYIGIMIWMFRAMSKGGGAGMFGGMNQNRPRETKSTVKFSDVAGSEEEKQEMYELVDYLKQPNKYAQYGARVPKGILMEGPPGTGKTLLAKAVAGEAGVSFYSMAGSEFEEMFVGLGASRVRSLFADAKKTAPCIIFIDEIDAVGRKRSGAAGTGTSEQTLNQLLVEMDGFETNAGVIVMAATNRVDVLDSALLRPGRFDRTIQISLPDIKEREAILKLHARNKNVAKDIEWKRIAERTPGFSGAQLENVLNEAAILIVREKKKVITIVEIDEAIDRVVGGPAKKSRVMTLQDKQVVSYHEAGHALIGLKLESASKVQKVTIIPRGNAGGYTIMTPKV